ncbi:T9SS type A sorting domain-containing protein [Cesiribacter andamanensis]|uniref:Secretion system C-terminal sorting domain-containing protein n=1 Tax=Cesiribacter andamanensis AMV16 TaxID=1279009 RepID=M7N643_9BACT|nr:T9SS type A sorting domain-containing protein [Cesiribacter andamanensis]EMR04098.1 hypothetical protein ADICEAN_00721 [Cesiribacter andamanensis AMV16]
MKNNIHTTSKKILLEFSLMPQLALMLALLLALPLSLYAQKPAASLEQVRNGGASSPVSPGNWQNGNLNASQAHFVESHSIPYRALLTGLPSNTRVSLTMAYDIRHSGRNALDFLTHFDRIEPHGQFFHPAEVIDPTLGTTFAGQLASPTSTLEIPRPTLLRGDGVPGTVWDQLTAAKRVMTMWGGFIESIVYDGSGDLSVSNSEQRIIVTFMTGNSGAAVLAWGGHIASRLDWGYDNAGVPLSAGGISGSPYHMRLKNWTLGNLGNQDRSLAAAAVIAPPGCALTGATAACAGEVNTYSTTETADSYAWTFAANTSGAFFTNSNGDNLGSSVTTNTGSIMVNSGPGGGSYTVNLVTTRNGISSTDICQVTAIITAIPARPDITYNPPACDETTFSIEVTCPLGAQYEYSNNGGATYQASPIFGGIAAGAGFSVTVRVVGTSCVSAATHCGNYDTQVCSASAAATSLEKDQQSSSQRLGTGELNLKSNVSAYPVPFKEKLNLEFYSERDGTFRVNLYDMGGKLIRQLKAGTGKAGDLQRIEVDGKDLEDGMYLVGVENGSERQTIRIIKKE